MTNWKAIAWVSISLAIVSAAWGHAQQRAAGNALSAQDYIDIQQLYASYNHALDASDANAFVANFTPDGAVGDAAGREALLSVINRTKQQWKGTWRHLYSNLIVKPAPGGASGTSFLFAYDTSTKPATITNTGIYEDILVKTAEGWRFKKRTFRNDAPAR
jgi:hypothetical protein